MLLLFSFTNDNIRQREVKELAQVHSASEHWELRIGPRQVGCRITHHCPYNVLWSRPNRPTSVFIHHTIQMIHLASFSIIQDIFTGYEIPS